jgi:hypothetical protein
MKPPMRYSMLLTHGAAILLGCVGGKTLLSGGAMLSPPAGNSTPVSSRSSVGEISSKWIDLSLGEIREKTTKTEADAKPVTIAELLRRNRETADGDRKECEAEVDQIIRNSARYANESDFLAAIRRSIHGNLEDEHTGTIFQAWLDKDPAAALAELGRNWSLSDDSDIPSLLERKFGRAWVKQQVEDLGLPIRHRGNLADNLGRDLAWEGGLPALLEQYNAISDVETKQRLVGGFSWSWPLDDPLATGRFLAAAPVEMREGLMHRLAPPAPFGLSGFPANSSMPTPYVSREWFEKVRTVIHPDSVDEMVAPISNAHSPASDSLADAVKAGVTAGGNREGVVANVLYSKVRSAMGEGTDLGVLYSEGKMSRSELLQELTKRIHGAEAFPDILEREAWRATSMTSDSAESARWARELPEQEAENPLVPDGVGVSGTYGDPRIPLRLSRYQVFADGVSDQAVLGKVRDRQCYE